MAVGKGGKFERDVARELSLWWTKGKSDDCFWRNRLRRTGKAYNAQMQEGDIIAVREVGIPLTEFFCIECKSGYSIKKSPTNKTKAKRANVKEKVKNIPWDLLEVVDGNGLVFSSLVISKFWTQTIKAANLVKKMPLLIFKRDFHVPVVVVNHFFMDKFLLKPGWTRQPEIMVFDLIENDVLYFYRLEIFLKKFDPSWILEKRNV